MSSKSKNYVAIVPFWAVGKVSGFDYVILLKRGGKSVGQSSRFYDTREEAEEAMKVKIKSLVKKGVIHE